MKQGIDREIARSVALVSPGVGSGILKNMGNIGDASESAGDIPPHNVGYFVGLKISDRCQRLRGRFRF